MKAAKVLFLVQLPPPIHGVTVMNQMVVNSEMLWRDYICKTLPIRISRSNTEIGILSATKIIKTIGLLIRLLFVLLTFRPHIVYFTFSPVGLNAYRDCLLVLLIKLCGAKAVLHLHGQNIEKAVEKNRFLSAVLTKTLSGTHIICLSSRLVADVARVYRGKPFIMPNTIEYDPANIRVQKTARQQPRILFLSNLRREKGIFTFLDAMGELKKRGCDYDARIVGHPYRLSVEQIRSEVEARGIADRVTVLGARSDEEKYQELSEADLLVFPSQNEAFPLVLIEAAAWGIPVVASEVGAIRDIIRDGVNGFIVPGDDHRAYADKIQLLLNDPQLRGKMGSASRKIYTKNYTLEIFQQSLRNVFESVLHSVL